MKRFVFACLIMAAVLGLSFGVQSFVQAEDEPMTQAHIDRIKANCVDAQALLQQLHSSDALLRVNQGPLYELISTNLMAPLNSRIALNRLDGTDLVSTTASYEQELTTFRSSYNAYEVSLSHALKLNCVNQPVAFYDSVGDARGKRQKVHDSVQRLSDLIRQYHDDFKTFSADVESGDES